MEERSCDFDNGWIEQAALPRTAEAEKESVEGMSAAMAQIAAHTLGKSAELSSSGILNVTLGGDAPPAASEHDQLSVHDLMEIYDCGYSKAQRMMKALPSFKVGNKRYVLREDLESYVAEHGTIPVNW